MGWILLSFKMYFYAVECPDGTVHVQNYVGPYRGQHHVHSKESFERWRRENGLEVKVVKGECNCGLKPGDVKEYDGNVWHNPKWE
jgi:hypothetical protein